jgi:metal transporter CNNM
MNIVLLILIIIILVGFSAVCSGLNVAVMSLEPADLERKAKLGNKFAQTVLPLRKNTHLTLASILLTNIAAVSATSLVLHTRLVGWLAGGISTLLIVVFGEVIPQAIFSNTPLQYTARFSQLLKVMIIISYPFSKPLQLLLDRLFPRANSTIQTRQELGLLINEHLTDDRSELDDDEVEIIRGALQLSEKRVKSIMTPIRQTYWLTPDTALDDAKIDEIKDRGYSRIPIFDEQLSTSYGLLMMKSLVDIDFDEVLYRVSDMKLHPSEAIGSMTALDTLFRLFISKRTHLLPVEKDEKIVGIVTIEDLIEEIIGHEIEDESDRYKHL